MNKNDITKKTAKHDWSRLEAMSESEKLSAAESDCDARPIEETDFSRMKQRSRVAIIRRALGLTQEEFSSRFHIPIGTLRDWEQGRKQPDSAAQAYLKVIARQPDLVAETLSEN